MADIKKIKIDNTEYNVKDKQARDAVEGAIDEITAKKADALESIASTAASEKREAIEAIAAEGTSVLSSIPSDYSDLSAAVGPDEASSTASAAHPAGSYFIYDGGLYEATLNIAAGGTIVTSGTGQNCRAVTGGIAEEVVDLKSAISNIEDVVYVDGTSLAIKSETTGKALNANGNQTTNADAKIVTYKVTAGDLIHIVAQKDTEGVYQFSRDSAISSTYRVGDTITVATDDYVVVPATAIYLHVSQLLTTATNKACYADSIADSIEQIKDSTDDFEDKVTDILFYDGTPLAVKSETTGKAINLSGNQTTNADAKIVTYKVTAGDLIHIVAQKDTEGVYQFSRDSAISSTYRVGDTITVATDDYVVVPATAIYLHVSQLLTTTTNKACNAYTLADIVNGDIPDYWITYLDGKLPDIKSNIISVGNQGDTFMLVTDTHWESNRKHSPAIMKYLKDRANISFCVNCGDLIQGTATAAEALALLDDYCNQIKGAEPFYCVRGNHDTNMDGSYQTGEITMGQWYAIMDKPIESFVDTEQKPYFYKDNTSQKIRYIFVDEEINAEWIGTVVASTPGGYSIVVFSHYLFTPKASSDTSALSISSYGEEIINAIDNNKPESVTVVGIFAGHVHRDYYTNASAGYLLVGTTCDANAAYGFDPDNPNRTEGTTGEQVIDVVSINTYSRTVNILRIGAGSSRTGLTY